MLEQNNIFYLFKVFINVCPKRIYIIKINRQRISHCDFSVLSKIISLRQETICDALTLTGWIKFLSNFFSSLQILNRCQHQNVKNGRPSPLTSTLPHCIGNLGFQPIWAQHQKFVAEPPRPPPYRKFGISADLDSASKVGDRPPYIGNLGFQQIWAQHQKLVADPPPPQPYRKFWDLCRFGLSIKSWSWTLPHHIGNLGFQQI